MFEESLPWKITLEEVSIKFGLCPDSSLPSDIILCNRYFMKHVQVSAEQILSDVLHLIILSYSFVFSKILLWEKQNTTKQEKPKAKQNTIFQKSNFSWSFKTDFSGTLSFRLLTRQRNRNCCTSFNPIFFQCRESCFPWFWITQCFYSRV